MIGLEQFGRRGPDSGIRIPLRRLDLAAGRYRFNVKGVMFNTTRGKSDPRLLKYATRAC